MTSGEKAKLAVSVVAIVATTLFSGLLNPEARRWLGWSGKPRSSGPGNVTGERPRGVEQQPPTNRANQSTLGEHSAETSPDSLNSSTSTKPQIRPVSPPLTNQSDLAHASGEPAPKTSEVQPNHGSSALAEGILPGCAPGGEPSTDPVVTSVSPIRPTGKQTIVIKGIGFGCQNPFNGFSRFLRITDLRGNWYAGLAESYAGFPPNPVTAPTATVYVTRWIDSEIVIEGFGGSYGGDRVLVAGDVVKIEVANPQGPPIWSTDGSTSRRLGAISLRVSAFGR